MGTFNQVGRSYGPFHGAVPFSQGMAASYRSQLELPVNQQLEGHELLAYLLQAEKLHRGNDRMESLLKTARFRFNVTSQEIECGADRNLSKASWGSLLEG